MNKLAATSFLALLSQSAAATIVNVDFLVDATVRRTSNGGVWVNDTGFQGQQFSLRLRLDSENYLPGTVDYWDGQGVSSVYSTVEPVEFGATPFDAELNAVVPTLDYHGNPEYGPNGYFWSDFSYNQNFDSATVQQSFSQANGYYYYDSATRYIADLDRDTIIDLFWSDAPYSESNITTLPLVDLLNLGMGQSYSFSQYVQESSTENFGAWPPNTTLVDGGIYYTGYATMTNVSVVPIPAALWLFASGLVGMFGLSANRRSPIGNAP